MSASRTPLQTAIAVSVGSYRAAIRLLVTEKERRALCDVLAAAIARDVVDLFVDVLDDDDLGEAA
jgi:hypothetical protein